MVILLGAAALRLAFLAGFIFYDDAYYVDRAVALGLGKAGPPESIFATRIGLVGPAALLYRLFGVGPLTTAAFPLLCSLGSVAAAFYFGRRLLGPRTGIIAAVLLAVFPLDVLFAGTLFGTTPVTFFVGVSLGLFLIGEQTSRAGFAFASGLSLGLGALVHETALLALVFYPAYVVFLARPSRRHALFVLGLFLALGLDPLVHALLGDPWARLAILRNARVVQGTSPDSYSRGLNVAWIFEPLLRMLSEQELGLFPWLVVPVAALRLFKPDRATVAALALFVTVVSLWLLYGTVSPMRYAPLSRQPRYLAPVVLPAVLLLGHEITRWRRRLLGRVVIVVLVVSSVCCVVVDGGRARLWPYREARAVLAKVHPSVVLVGPRLRLPLLFAEGFAPRYELGVLDSASEPPHGAVIIVASDDNRRFGAVPGRELLARIPQPETVYFRLLRTPVVAAVLRLTRPDARLHDLERKARAPALELYRIP